ncbi:PREDICTED: iron-sulfur cluster assembly 1 homolog, mitochondrial [Aptenodytes forsteri]|uniref:iron-sulfur cluster assembly 1 homolog, mitochondrial n=1 Tax=Aptenodytes forsteri TaxID=9233 RepID=UPI000905D85F|nr:PREDICTED: iron-sulfur cluster assembly 1 homolog, mitochondrial [Aptenodytes forsteri]
MTGSILRKYKKTGTMYHGPPCYQRQLLPCRLPAQPAGPEGKGLLLRLPWPRLPLISANSPPACDALPARGRERGAALTANNQKKPFQIDVYVFVFQTPSAVQKIKQLLKDKPEHVGVKVGVRTRGCNGLSYTLEYTKSKGDSDEEVVQDGVRVFIEKKAQLTLLGTEMDYVEDKLSSEFVFNNPNIKGTCGCGESFNI